MSDVLVAAVGRLFKLRQLDLRNTAAAGVDGGEQGLPPAAVVRLRQATL